jgi:hypothetical protein
MQLEDPHQTLSRYWPMLLGFSAPRTMNQVDSILDKFQVSGILLQQQKTEKTDRQMHLKQENTAELQT